MHVHLDRIRAMLPLPATEAWPRGVRDVEALSHGSMSAVFFAPSVTDDQTSHDRDELYVIVGGTGTLVVGDTRSTFRPGDLLFVPADAKHRFEEFSADFATWAVFWGPKGGEP